MANSPMKILLFLGSTRDGRMADRVLPFVMNHLQQCKPEYSIEVIDPKVLNLPVLVQPIHFMKDPKEAPQVLQTLHEKIRQADGFVILTPEYNRQLPPALTNTLNHFPPASYAYKAATIVSYSMGGGGGVIAAHQCRSLMVELGCAPASQMLQIGGVNRVLAEDGSCTEERLNASMVKQIAQFDWWLQATANQRAIDEIGANGKKF